MRPCTTMDAWIPLLKDLISSVQQKYGVFAALLILFFIFHELVVYRLWKGRLKDKDREIERLVQERNRLQEVILPERLSSGGKK